MDDALKAILIKIALGEYPAYELVSQRIQVMSRPHNWMIAQKAFDRLNGEVEAGRDFGYAVEDEWTTGTYGNPMPDGWVREMFKKAHGSI